MELPTLEDYNETSDSLFYESAGLDLIRIKCKLQPKYLNAARRVIVD